jgi:prepilin-type N-terminal cleavage/methylation domain-containing protein
MKLFSRGFTLIEILVVVAIISILAAVLYANFGDARTDARNKTFQSELKEMQLALELYRSQFGRYPEAQSGGPSSCNDATVASSAGCEFSTVTYPYIAGLTPDFIDELLTHNESANPSCDVVYETDAGGTWYKLTAENCYAGATAAGEGIQPDSEFARCPSSCATCSGDTYDTDYVASALFYESMAVYSVGGQCE